MADEPKLELFNNQPEPTSDIQEIIRRALFYLLFFIILLMIAAFGLIAEA